MDSGEKPDSAQGEPVSFGEVARRFGGALANLVPNSRPIARQRPEEHEEPRFSLDPTSGEHAAAEADVHSLDARRKKREPTADKPARNLDALRKKKSA